MLAIIDRHLLREAMKATLAFLLVLVLVLASHIFIRFLESVVVGELSPRLLFQFLGFEILKQLPRIIPPAFFFSILFTLGRMYRDSEMVALASCGVGIVRIYRSYLLAAVLLAGVEAWLSLTVMPWATRTVEEMKYEQQQSVDVAGIEAGQFNEYSRGDLVFYAEKLSEDGKKMLGIFVQNRQQGPVGLITAEQGHQYIDKDSGDRFLVLENGYRYSGVIGTSDYSIGQFKQYAVRISQSTKKLQRLRHRAKSTRDLWRSRELVDRAELQFRISLPMAILVFAVLSIPLSRSLPRQGIFGRLLVAFILYFIFINLQDVSESWMQDGVTPLWLGMWWVHVLMLLIGAGLNLPDTAWFSAMRYRLAQGRA